MKKVQERVLAYTKAKIIPDHELTAIAGGTAGQSPLCNITTFGTPLKNGQPNIIKEQQLDF